MMSITEASIIRAAKPCIQHRQETNDSLGDSMETCHTQFSHVEETCDQEVNHRFKESGKARLVHAYPGNARELLREGIVCRTYSEAVDDTPTDGDGSSCHMRTQQQYGGHSGQHAAYLPKFEGVVHVNDDVAAMRDREIWVKDCGTESSPTCIPKAFHSSYADEKNVAASKRDNGQEDLDKPQPPLKKQKRFDAYKKPKAPHEVNEAPIHPHAVVSSAGPCQTCPGPAPAPNSIAEPILAASSTEAPLDHAHSACADMVSSAGRSSPVELAEQTMMDAAVSQQVMEISPRLDAMDTTELPGHCNPVSSPASGSGAGLQLGRSASSLQDGALMEVVATSSPRPLESNSETHMPLPVGMDIAQPYRHNLATSMAPIITSMPSASTAHTVATPTFLPPTPQQPASHAVQHVSPPTSPRSAEPPQQSSPGPSSSTAAHTMGPSSAPWHSVGPSQWFETHDTRTASSPVLAGDSTPRTQLAEIAATKLRIQDIPTPRTHHEEAVNALISLQLHNSSPISTSTPTFTTELKPGTSHPTVAPANMPPLSYPLPPSPTSHVEPPTLSTCTAIVPVTASHMQQAPLSPHPVSALSDLTAPSSTPPPPMSTTWSMPHQPTSAALPVNRPTVIELPASPPHSPSCRPPPSSHQTYHPTSMPSTHTLHLHVGGHPSAPSSSLPMVSEQGTDLPALLELRQKLLRMAKESVDIKQQLDTQLAAINNMMNDHPSNAHHTTFPATSLPQPVPSSTYARAGVAPASSPLSCASAASVPVPVSRPVVPKLHLSALQQQQQQQYAASTPMVTTHPVVPRLQLSGLQQQQQQQQQCAASTPMVTTHPVVPSLQLSSLQQQISSSQPSLSPATTSHNIVVPRLQLSFLQQQHQQHIQQVHITSARQAQAESSAAIADSLPRQSSAPAVLEQQAAASMGLTSQQLPSTTVSPPTMLLSPHLHPHMQQQQQALHIQTQHYTQPQATVYLQQQQQQQQYLTQPTYSLLSTAPVVPSPRQVAVPTTSQPAYVLQAGSTIAGLQTMPASHFTHIPQATSHNGVHVATHTTHTTSLGAQTLGAQPILTRADSLNSMLLPTSSLQHAYMQQPQASPRYLQQPQASPRYVVLPSGLGLNTVSQPSYHIQGGQVVLQSQQQVLLTSSEQSPRIHTSGVPLSYQSVQGGILMQPQHMYATTATPGMCPSISTVPGAVTGQSYISAPSVSAQPQYVIQTAPNQYAAVHQTHPQQQQQQQQLRLATINGVQQHVLVSSEYVQSPGRAVPGVMHSAQVQQQAGSSGNLLYMPPQSLHIAAGLAGTSVGAPAGHQHAVGTYTNASIVGAGGMPFVGSSMQQR